MEPISYLRAPLRRWPVVVPFVVILAIVAVLIPYSPKGKYPVNTWEAPSDLGLTPAFPGNKLGAKLGVKQLEFYVHQPAVIAAAAKAEHVKVTNKLRKDVVITKSKKSTVTQGDKEAIVGVAVLQRKKAEAVNFTNTFVVALDKYAQLQIDEQQKKLVATETAYVHNLQTAIANLPHKTKTHTTPTTHPHDHDHAPGGAPRRPPHAPRPHTPDDNHDHEAGGSPQRAGKHVEHVRPSGHRIQCSGRRVALGVLVLSRHGGADTEDRPGRGAGADHGTDGAAVLHLGPGPARTTGGDRSPRHSGPTHGDDDDRRAFRKADHHG